MRCRKRSFPSERSKHERSEMEEQMWNIGRGLVNSEIFSKSVQTISLPVTWLFQVGPVRSNMSYINNSFNLSRRVGATNKFKNGSYQIHQFQTMQPESLQDLGMPVSHSHSLIVSSLQLIQNITNLCVKSRLKRPWASNIWECLTGPYTGQIFTQFMLSHLRPAESLNRRASTPSVFISYKSSHFSSVKTLT